MSETQTVARLTEESIERMRRRIGIRIRSNNRPHNEWVTYDGIHHFARGNGDMNPLWLDRGYARESVWGDVIGSPLFAFATGVREPVEWTPAEREAMSGGDPFRGIGQYHFEDVWTLAGPLRIGQRLVATSHLQDLKVAESSKFAGGLAVYLTYRHTYALDTAPFTVLAVCDRTFLYADRDKSSRSDSAARYEYSRTYTPEQIAEIDAAYEAEYIRGSDVLRHSDVNVGDDLGRIVKGPLSITDIIGFHISWGFGELFDIGALRAGYLNRKRIPGFYVPNEDGIPDAAQRCHWETAWAQKLGHPVPYDYGIMRTLWTIQLVTNWMGDAGLIQRVQSKITRFNYIGDTTWITGKVVDKLDDPVLGPLVRVAVVGTNQAGIETCVTELDVRLPLDDGAPRPYSVLESL